MAATRPPDPANDEYGRPSVELTPRKWLYSGNTVSDSDLVNTPTFAEEARLLKIEDGIYLVCLLAIRAALYNARSLTLYVASTSSHVPLPRVFCIAPLGPT